MNATWKTRSFLLGAFLVVLVGLSSCTVTHSITVRADRSALVSSSSNWGADWRGLYNIPNIREIDTSGIHGMFGGGALFIIDDIDSLGNHLSNFGTEQLKFKLEGDVLSIKAAPQGATLDGWSVTRMTLFLERGIAKVNAYQKTRPQENLVSFKITRRQMRKHPDTVDLLIQMKGASR